MTEKTKHDATAPDDKSVLLIFKDETMRAEIDTVVSGMPHFKVGSRTGTLAGMNGTAVSLAAENDLVIFETTAASDDDFSAVMALRSELDRGAKLLAITSEDISLAEARRLTRAGVDDVLTYPINARDLRDQVERWTRPKPPMVLPLAVETETRQGKVVTVAQARGGVGATMLAVNLADRLLDRTGIVRKRSKNRVALVDLDLQFGAVASMLDIDGRDGLFQLAMDGVKPDITFVRQSMSQSASGIDVLSAPTRFAPLDALKAEQIGTLIDLLRAEYDFVVVDLPHALVGWIAPVLEKTDQMLLVTDSSVPAIRQARRLIDFYTEDNITLKIEIVINHEAKPFIRNSAHAEAAKVLERPFRHWLPHDPKAARSAVDRGMPLSATASRSALSKAIGTLSRTLMVELAKTTSVENQPASFVTVRK